MNPNTRLLVSAGGTGGGIYPALAVVAAIRKLAPSVQIGFVGSADGLEHELIQATQTHFESYDTVQAGPLHGVHPLRALLSLLKLSVGFGQAFWLLARRRPQAVFSTGGWVSVPLTLAAFFCRIPNIIFVPDIEPGLTLKAIGRFSRIITATTEETGAFFPRKKVLATGYPLREAVLNATREAGLARFSLSPDIKTLLVFGGSRGARSINQAILQIAPALLAESDLQILHVTGSLDWEAAQKAYAALPQAAQKRYQIHEYLHDLGLAMAAADVVVSRAGASCLGEFPHFELPAFLIPYPHAWRYQKVNAEWLVLRGAAQLLEDESLNETLLPSLRAWLDDPERQAQMKQAAADLRISDGAERIARLILEGIN